MHYSKFSEKPAFNENHGFLNCTCGQFLEFKSIREEKLKIRLHSKNFSKPPEGIETIKPPGKRFSKTEAEHAWNEYLKKFCQYYLQSWIDIILMSLWGFWNLNFS